MINIPLNQILLSEFRRLTREELQQVRDEAKRTIKIHQHNAIGGMLSPFGYLEIPEVKAEIRACESVVEHADAVLAEWQPLLHNGDTLASEVVGMTPQGETP